MGLHASETMDNHKRRRPWHREPWPWILMSGPALVVVAGVVTTVIAVRTSDGVVADDYYKQGLGINRTLARDARADALHVVAEIQFNEERTAARVRLSGETRPEALKLTLVHPTRAGGDQSVTLRRVFPSPEGEGPSFYEGRIHVPREGTWRLRVEDERQAWRLTGAWRTEYGVVTLRPQS
jgi:uncharacterized protein